MDGQHDHKDRPIGRESVPRGFERVWWRRGRGTRTGPTRTAPPRIRWRSRATRRRGVAGGWGCPEQGCRVQGTWDWLFVVACGGVFLVLAFLGRSMTFWLDDWVHPRQPGSRGLDVGRLHASPQRPLAADPDAGVEGPAVDRRVAQPLALLLATLALHITAAVAAYVLVRRQAGPFIAFSAGLLFLLLGTAGEVFFFAAAFNLVAATAFGSWALLLALSVDSFRPLGRGRQVFVAMLLLAAAASGGPGLFYLAAISAVLLLVTGRRRELWVVLPAGIAFAGWEVAYGSGSGSLDAFSDVSALRTLGDYVRTGVAHASGAVMGLEDQVGLVIAVALAGRDGVASARPRPVARWRRGWSGGPRQRVPDHRDGTCAPRARAGHRGPLRVHRRTVRAPAAVGLAGGGHTDRGTSTTRGARGGRLHGRRARRERRPAPLLATLLPRSSHGDACRHRAAGAVRRLARHPG